MGLDGEEEGFEPDYGDAGEVADEGEPCDATEIPHEGYFFNAHCYNTRCRTDDEHTATDTGTEGEKVPEETVLHEEGGVGVIA